MNITFNKDRILCIDGISTNIGWTKGSRDATEQLKKYHDVDPIQELTRVVIEELEHEGITLSVEEKRQIHSLIVTDQA